MIYEETNQLDDFLLTPFGDKTYIRDNDGNVGEENPEARLSVASIS
jgi:hypothetical protein